MQLVCSVQGCTLFQCQGVKCIYHGELARLARLCKACDVSEKKEIDSERTVLKKLFKEKEYGKISERVQSNRHSKKYERISKRVQEKKRTNNNVSRTETKSRTDSICQKHVISNVEKKIRRHTGTDGSIVETEEQVVRSEEFSITFMRKFEDARVRFSDRIIREENDFVNTMITSDGWLRFAANSNKHKCKDTRGLFAFQNESLSVCVNKHTKQWTLLSETIRSTKPPILSVKSKYEWYNQCYHSIWKLYPTDIANAFYFIRTIYELVLRLTCNYNGPDKKIWYNVPLYTFVDGKRVINKRPRLLYASPSYHVDNFGDLANDAIAAYKMVDAWLPKSKLAGKLEQAKNIIKFVTNFENGNYTSLYNQLMSVQFSIRLIRDLPDAPKPHDITIWSVEKGGSENAYNSMLYNSCDGYASYQKQKNVWITLTAEYKKTGIFELILIRQVAFRLFGETLRSWHQEVYAPALAKEMQAAGEIEKLFVYGDICMPMRLMTEPEYSPLLQEKIDRDRSEDNSEIETRLEKYEENCLNSIIEKKEVMNTMIQRPNPFSKLEADFRCLLKCNFN